MITTQEIDIDMSELGQAAAGFWSMQYPPFANFIAGAAEGLDDHSGSDRSKWIEQQISQLAEDDDQDALDLLVALGKAAAKAKADAE